MPTTTLDNQRLFYSHTTPPRAAGADPLPALVLVHGAAGSHLDWPPNLRRFPGFEVFALDLPGHGRSDLPGRASVPEYAAIVASFLRQVVPGPGVLVGHSLGGAIAQWVALEPPTQLRGIVLMGTGPRLPVSRAILDQLPEQFPAVADSLVRAFWGEAAPASLVERSRESLLRGSASVARQDFLACDAFDVSARLGAIHLPALIIAAAGDRLTPPHLARELAEGLPQSQLLVLPGGGHMLALERPEPIADAVGAFLETVFGFPPHSPEAVPPD